MELKIEFPPNPNDRCKLKEIVNAICAVVNSCKEGGQLILFSKSSPYSQKMADDITRKIEQKLESTFDAKLVYDIMDKIPAISDTEVYELRYQINPISTLCTVKYNLYRTTDAQVYDMPASKELEYIAEVINGEQRRVKNHVLGKHHKNFSYGAKISLEEGKGVQFKLIKDDVSEKRSLTERMTNDSNKLAQYIAAFANGYGGHIYYGIQFDESDSYIVYGQIVSDQGEIVDKVASLIDKLFVWPGINKCLKKGQHWDIYFEDVSNTEAHRSVIIISVNSHDKGVFVREPESYIVSKVNESLEVQRMNFREWTDRFLLSNCTHVFSHEMVPRIICRYEWSSPEALRNHVSVLSKLVILRNDGCEKEFEAYKKELLASSETSARCLGEQQEAADHFRKKRLDDAERKLRENGDFLKLNESPEKCSDVGVYQTRRLYWMSVVKRAQGNFEKSRHLCEAALQWSQHQPTILVLSWLHYNKAKILENEIIRENATSEERRLRDKSMACYESALRSSFALQGFPENLVVDLKLRVIIAMARLSFGAFYDGKRVIHKTCSRRDVEHAERLLKDLRTSLEKHALLMTKLCKAEYLLVQAELYYSGWKKESKRNFLAKARKKSMKAFRIAEAKNFKDVRNFAIGQIEIFDNEMQKVTIVA